MSDQSKSGLPHINSTSTTVTSSGGGGLQLTSGEVRTSTTSGSFDTGADYCNPRDSDNKPLTRYNDIENRYDPSIVLPRKLGTPTYETKSSATAGKSTSTTAIDESYKVYNHGPELLDTSPGPATQLHKAKVQENIARLKGLYGVVKTPPE